MCKSSLIKHLRYNKAKAKLQELTFLSNLFDVTNDRLICLVHPVTSDIGKVSLLKIPQIPGHCSVFEDYCCCCCLSSLGDFLLWQTSWHISCQEISQKKDWGSLLDQHLSDRASMTESVIILDHSYWQEFRCTDLVSFSPKVPSLMSGNHGKYPLH